MTPVLSFFTDFISVPYFIDVSSNKKVYTSKFGLLRNTGRSTITYSRLSDHIYLLVNFIHIFDYLRKHNTQPEAKCGVKFTKTIFMYYLHFTVG